MSCRDQSKQELKGVIVGGVRSLEQPFHQGLNREVCREHIDKKSSMCSQVKRDCINNIY